MTEPTVLTAPYAPFERSLASLVVTGLPATISRATFDRSSGTTAKELVHAYNFLNLTESSGAPTERLSELVEAWKRGNPASALEAMLRDRYGQTLDLAKLDIAGPEEVKQAFATAFPASDRDATRHVTFVINAAVAAGLPLSGQLLRMIRRRREGPNGDVVPKPDEAKPFEQRPTSILADDAPASSARSAVPEAEPWDATRAAHILIDHVFDPDRMPEGSEALQALIALLSALKRLR